LNYEAIHPPLNPQKYTFLRGFEPEWGGFHPKRTRILHGNCTVEVHLLIGKMGEGSLEVKGVNGEFSNTGTGGNISRGDHSSRSTRSKDNGVTLFVKGGGFRLFHHLFEKTL